MRPPPTDADLLAHVAAGDRAAFEAFYRRHAAWLVLRLRHRCPDDGLVDEVVQETFLDVWRGAARFHASATSPDVAGWLWRVGSRRLVDALRKRHSRHRLGRLLARFRSGSEPSAEEQVLLGVEHGDLSGALARLSPELRAVVQATVIDGLSTAEAAVLLGIPAGTVKSRAMRARQQLRAELT
ncbi:RNA polymerase sigma24 factor [Asanoa ishikariensis]|uniref:RNA polymerase sigma-70 factor, ECF subfamily n=1 Tax=Asanoa ishikariensis TaxID=137265 RepID=A0A1H3T762_9ACTN|nr:RNA polymerase sigma factor [Asanoa ishikariensis]GIF62911.1 RNA polymerase sigma24 factor [Asanoa ishikariensis]SDZ46064.1 RNA polymerase sigma-70 factor, ECF subfamily [Asanoa ishikariensis]